MIIVNSARHGKNLLLCWCLAMHCSSNTKLSEDLLSLEQFLLAQKFFTFPLTELSTTLQIALTGQRLSALPSRNPTLRSSAHSGVN